MRETLNLNQQGALQSTARLVSNRLRVEKQALNPRVLVLSATFYEIKLYRGNMEEVQLKK